MKKKNMYVVLASLLISIFMLTACEGNKAQGTEVKNTETQNQSESINTELNSEEPSTEKEAYVWWYETEWEEVVASGEPSAKKFDEAFVSENADISKWFTDYNGEKIHRIEEDYSSGITTCGDIIYYNTEETDIQTVVKTMLTTMIDPFKEPHDTRGYTVIRYELDEEQPIVQISENVWVLRIISGYYEYEGKVLVGGTMEDALEAGGKQKDGMVRFFAQGGDSVFQYIILKEGNVYRIQRAGDMGYCIGDFKV